MGETRRRDTGAAVERDSDEGERSTSVQEVPRRGQSDEPGTDRMSYEQVPGIQGSIARRMFERLSWLIPEQHLSFGGGTVLAARWQHRTSLDVDLFCDPTVYGRLSRKDRENMEKSLHEIEGCAKEKTWCEDIATYTEIDGIEATILPRVIALEPTSPTTLRGTGLALHGSAQILYAKIAWRMYEGGEIAVRDAYDLAAAGKHDPDALVRACEHASPQVLETVSEVIELLPTGWSEESEKPLIDPRYRWSETELEEQALAALRTPHGAKGRDRGSQER